MAWLHENLYQDVVMEKEKYFSLFTGIGGFELGIGAGHECVGYSEIDKYAIKIYQKHFPNHKNYGDITKINEKELPAFDLLVGGFPCQSFSIAGKRGGFEDTRGTLFFDIARILKEKQPRLLLLENVKGLLSHDNGNTFKVIITTLAELGYDLQWQVLNSKNHGVPQNRERIFIVGNLRGTTRPQVFPFGKNDGVSDSSEPADAGRAQAEVSHTIRGSSVKADQLFVGTLRTHKGGNRQPFIQNPKMLNYKKDYDNSVAITATSYKEPPVVNAIRRLTPTECERLQGFPDGWTKFGLESKDIGNGGELKKNIEISDTQRYKCLGNAVTVNVIRDIIERLL